MTAADDMVQAQDGRTWEDTKGKIFKKDCSPCIEALYSAGIRAMGAVWWPTLKPLLEISATKSHPGHNKFFLIKDISLLWTSATNIGTMTSHGLAKDTVYWGLVRSHPQNTLSLLKSTSANHALAP